VEVKEDFSMELMIKRDNELLRVAVLTIGGSAVVGVVIGSIIPGVGTAIGTAIGGIAGSVGVIVHEAGGRQ
jgi:ATP-dependent protease ClpP protease subunit